MIAVLDIYDAYMINAIPNPHFHWICPLGHFDLVVAMSVCSLFLCVSPFHVLDFEAFFAPTSWSRMSKIFRDSESLGEKCWKVVVSDLIIFVGKWSKIAALKKSLFFADFAFTKHGGNHASRWIRDLWSMGISLILDISRRFWVFLFWIKFFCFKIFFSFLCILGPPYCGIGATIRIGWDIRCLPSAGFFILATSTPSQVVPLVMPFLKLSLEPL